MDMSKKKSLEIIICEFLTRVFASLVVTCGLTFMVSVVYICLPIIIGKQPLFGWFNIWIVGFVLIFPMSLFEFTTRYRVKMDGEYDGLVDYCVSYAIKLFSSNDKRW